MSAVAVPRGTPAIVAGMARLADIDIDTNVRIDVGDLEGLAASIRALGVLEPVKVAIKGDRLSLVWGQRRVLAARLAGLDQIPVIYGGDATPSTRRSIEQLSENLVRRDLNPIEEAVALRAVLDADPELTQEALGDQLGRSRSWVANTLRLLGLADEVQAAVRTDAISASHAKAMASLPAKQQRELVTRVVEGNVSSHDLERDIKWKTQEAETEAAKVKRTERVAPKVVAALEKAEAPKTAKLFVAGPWDVDTAVVIKAIKAAGWRKIEQGYVYGDPSITCDCIAFKVEISGRGAGVTRHCDNDAHRDRDRKVGVAAREKAEAEREKAEAERREEIAMLAAAVRDSLIVTTPDSAILRILAFALRRAGGSWVEWSAVATLTLEQLIDQVVERLDVGYLSRDIDIPAILAELGVEAPA